MLYMSSITYLDNGRALYTRDAISMANTSLSPKHLNQNKRQRNLNGETMVYDVIVCGGGQAELFLQSAPKERQASC